MIPGDLEERRAHERGKYLAIREQRSDYGSSFHGRELVPRVLACNPEFVLDFGCGQNNFIQALNDHDIYGQGIDFAFPQADVLAPMHNTGFSDGVADVITAFDSLEHLLPDEVEDVLLEMRRVARPKFHFFFTIATSPSRITVNGENLHPTVKPIEWWVETISEVFQTTDIWTVGSLVWGQVTETETE